MVKITLTQDDLALLMFALTKYLVLSDYHCCAKAAGVSEEDYDFLMLKMDRMMNEISDHNVRK